MVEKYTDLTEEIWRADMGRTSIGSVRMVLDYLDRNPDQVPGRTITESEFEQIVSYEEARGASIRSKIRSALFTAGTIIVQDSEPANAEKWEAFIRGTHFNVSGWTGFDATEQFAKILDEQGVKAPGGDDD